MYAVFEDGSHQYKVSAGDTLEVDFRNEAQAGDALSFAKVLCAVSETGNVIGRPHLEGAVVEAEVVDPQTRGPKLEIGKFKRRKGYIRHNGHVQKYTAVRIKAISIPGFANEVAPSPAPKPEPAAT